MDAYFQANYASLENAAMQDFHDIKYPKSSITSNKFLNKWQRVATQKTKRQLWKVLGYMSADHPQPNARAIPIQVFMHESQFSVNPEGVHQSGSFVICGDASLMKIKDGLLGYVRAVRSANLVTDRDPLFKAAAYRWVGKMAPGSVKSTARLWLFLRFTKTGLRLLKVAHFGGLLIAVGTGVAEVWVAHDKVKAVVKVVGGATGALFGAGAVQSFFLAGPDQVGGPWAWGANIVGDLVGGGIGYAVGEKTAEIIYDFVVNPNPVSSLNDLTSQLASD